MSPGSESRPCSGGRFFWSKWVSRVDLMLETAGREEGRERRRERERGKEMQQLALHLLFCLPTPIHASLFTGPGQLPAQCR